MKNQIKSSKQQGQAIMELCICLIPILVIMLGLIFISGLGISNIRAFIQAKGNAELASRSFNALGGDGDNIYYWNYGTRDGNDDPNDIIDDYAFTANDEVILWQNGADDITGTLLDLQLNYINDSESLNEGANGEYIYMKTSNLTQVNDNFAQNLPGTMLAAAELVKATADSGFNNVFTLDQNHMEGIEDLNSTFSYLFGTEVDDIDLRNMRANTVYYP
ncbi:MAG: hypothetical protein KOO69_00015, partial [Victivallales bacterium]|nr:hypothetical protein [Victivallales bacterium]